jgi:hypothetical protein
MQRRISRRWSSGSKRLNATFDAMPLLDFGGQKLLDRELTQIRRKRMSLEDFYALQRARFVSDEWVARFDASVQQYYYEQLVGG